MHPFARSHEIKPQRISELGTHFNRHLRVFLRTVYRRSFVHNAESHFLCVGPPAVPLLSKRKDTRGHVKEMR